MLYLVDGYNVTKADPATRGLPMERQRDELVRRLRARGETLLGRGRIVVVFDGADLYGLPDPGGAVQVVFSRTGEKADDVIVRLAAQEAGAVALVGDDREIGERGRRLRGVRETSTLPRSAVFDGAAGRVKRARPGGAPPGMGVPPGGNAITKELKDLWLTDDEE